MGRGNEGRIAILINSIKSIYWKHIIAENKKVTTNVNGVWYMKLESKVGVKCIST
jgi:hypothetical protein